MCVTRTELCHLADAPCRGLCHNGEVAGEAVPATSLAADHRAVTDVSKSQTRVVALENERCGGIQQKGA